MDGWCRFVCLEFLFYYLGRIDTEFAHPLFDKKANKKRN